MKRRDRRWLIVIFVVSMLATAPLTASSEKPIYINLGTEAPEGSVWHEALLDIREGWSRISGGKVVLRIYPSGVQGDEGEMLRKVRLGQLDAVAISVGLTRLDPGVAALSVPLLIESYDELDYVLERLGPKLEERLAAKKYIVLNWSDVGWVHFFAKRPAPTLDSLRGMRLFTSAGDADTERLYKEMGFKPVPLSVTDLLPSLQTGLIEAMDVPPLLALVQQTFALAPYMTDVRWAPLVGATLVSERGLRKLPEPLREEMLELARSVTASRRDSIRRMGEEAILEMRQRGLEVVSLDEATMAGWYREVEEAYPKIRGRLVPADVFDEVTRLSETFEAEKRDTAEQLDIRPAAAPQ